MMLKTKIKKREEAIINAKLVGAEILQSPRTLGRAVGKKDEEAALGTGHFDGLRGPHHLRPGAEQPSRILDGSTNPANHAGDSSKHALRLLLRKRWAGSLWDIALSPWTLLMHVFFIYLLIAAGGSVVKATYIGAITISASVQSAVKDNVNGINADTGILIGRELADNIEKVVGPTNDTVVYGVISPTPPSLAVNDLRVQVNLFDGSYVTTAVSYGMPLPNMGFLNTVGYVNNTAIPIHIKLSFYRFW